MSTVDGGHDIYPPEFLSKMQVIWGEGFLSPGGKQAVDAILAGIALKGRAVLDIGSGLGGPAFLLADSYGAARVVGLEVQRQLVDQSRETANRIGLGNTVEFIAVNPGPLPLEDSSFDVVFSKDSIIHVADKAGLVSEIKRVLKPGGMVAISDWFGGTAPLSPEAVTWLEATGLTFALKPIGVMARLFEEAGFLDVTTEDRNSWFVEQAKQDVASLKGEAGRRLADAIGEVEAHEWLERSTKRAVVAEQGHLRPGHVRARKPA
jgi:phosphoethanolamine N-methyltransferase